MTANTAIVLAAGEGTRLRPLTRNRPKPMLPAATKPILEHVLDHLVDAGVDELVVVVGYRRDRVQSHFGPAYRDVPLTYVVQENQLGTGHALLAAEEVVDDTCLVVYGDQIVDRRLLADVASGHGPDDVATVGLLGGAPLEEYGGVRVEDGRVVELVENPRDDREYLPNVGVYAVEPPVFDAVRAVEPRAGEHLLVDGLSALAEGGRGVRGVVSDGLWADATYPWNLLDVADELLERDRVEGDRGSRLDPSATIHESAVLREPVVVDQDCEIGPGAVVGPHTCLGANATVGSNAVVERSVVDADTRIGANATVVDSVTGIGVTIGTGSTIPGGPGDVRVDGRIFEDEPFGALLADGASDRGGVDYVPGAIVGPDAAVETGATVRGVVAGGTEVRS